jgi:hypothetical protein
MGAGIPIYKIARPAPFHALGTFTSIEAARRTSICHIGEIRSAAPERIGVVSARAGGLAVAKVRGRRHGASTLRQIDRSRAVPPTMGAPPAIVRSKRPAQEKLATKLDQAPSLCLRIPGDPFRSPFVISTICAVAGCDLRRGRPVRLWATTSSSLHSGIRSGLVNRRRRRAAGGATSKAPSSTSPLPTRSRDRSCHH